MAHAIPLTVPTRDPRADMQSRLQSAPAEHAEALVAALEVLQGLHDSGLLDLARGALGSKDKVLDIAVRTAKTPESTRAIRNAMLLSRMLGAIEPEVMKSLTEAAPKALNALVREPEPPGLWRLIKDFLWNPDFRRGLAAVNTMLEALGSSLSRASKQSDKTQAAGGTP